MSGCDHIHTIEDVISFIMTNDTVNVPIIPDYSGRRVNTYYSVVQICYMLIQQR